MPAYHPTKEEIRLVDEQATILENTIKTHTKVVFDQYGPQVAMDMLLNAGPISRATQNGWAPRSTCSSPSSTNSSSRWPKTPPRASSRKQ